MYISTPCSSTEECLVGIVSYPHGMDVISNYFNLSDLHPVQPISSISGQQLLKRWHAASHQQFPARQLRPLQHPLVNPALAHGPVWQESEKVRCLHYIQEQDRSYLSG